MRRLFASLTRVMNTSSSEAGTARTLVDVDAGARAARRSTAAPRGVLGPRSGRSRDVDPLAEDLHVGDARRGSPSAVDRARCCGAAITSTTRPGRLSRSASGVSTTSSAPLGQQRDARAALGLVQVRRGHHDRDALREELRQQLPELAARHRIDAGRRLVEQDELAARGRACRRARASASCRPTAGRPAAPRNGVSCVMSSSRSRRACVAAAGRGSRRRTRCSRRCVRSP